MTDLQPCSPCREGNHDTCEATGNPFCGCRKANHNGALAGPVVAPISEVLAAGQRAPRPVVAEVAAQPAPAPGPVAAPAASISDLAGSISDLVLAQLAPVLGTDELPQLDDLEADDEPEAVLIDIPDRGQAGFSEPAAPAPAPTPTAPEAPEDDATSGAISPPTYVSIPMVAERDPSLYASVWDSDQAHFAEELPAVGYDPDPNQDAIEDAQEPEHTYAGTPEEPYACACGANPGTLNKLGSHLGITADVDAMAELGKAAVPNQLAQSDTLPVDTPAPEGQPDGIDTAGLALDGSRANVPTIEAEYLDERTGTIIGLVVANGCLVEVHQEGEGTFITFTRDDRTAGPYPVAELPEATPIITYLCSVEPLSPEGITKALEDLPEPETAIVGAPEPRTLAELETFGEPTPEDADVRSMALVADTVRSALEADEFGTSNMLAATTPWRLVLVNGDTGMVWEALYDDDQLPTEVADNLLEHFGFAPSPIDAEHPPVPRPSPPPVASHSGASMASLARTSTERPTRIQVARIATECSSCLQTIEPGETIGFFSGAGWRHLSHA